MNRLFHDDEDAAAEDAPEKKIDRVRPSGSPKLKPAPPPGVWGNCANENHALCAVAVVAQAPWVTAGLPPEPGVPALSEKRCTCPCHSAPANTPQVQTRPGWGSSDESASSNDGAGKRTTAASPRPLHNPPIPPIQRPTHFRRSPKAMNACGITGFDDLVTQDEAAVTCPECRAAPPEKRRPAAKKSTRKGPSQTKQNDGPGLFD
jgi:hypothetical protein